MNWKCGGARGGAECPDIPDPETQVEEVYELATWDLPGRMRYRGASQRPVRARRQKR